MATDIQKHFKSLRVQTARRRRDPFEDDSDDERNRRRTSSTSARKRAPAVGEPVKAPSVFAAPTKSSALAATDKLVDSDDERLIPTARSGRRPSPAPAQIARLPVSLPAGRRGSVDSGLQNQGLQGHRASRSARAQAAGPLAYLDDSDDEEALPPPPRTDRNCSPAPFRKSSDSPETQRRASTPRGTRDAPSEQHPVLPSRHTVASPFAGTKYLEDSDSDEEAVSSRSNSTDETAAGNDINPEKKERLEVERVDKPKVQNGGGVSWRAFSASRTEQRNTEIEALQASLRKRGKSISFGTHAVTDDGQRIPLPTQQLLSTGGGSKRGGAKNRGKSPPRRAEDTAAAEDEVADGGPVGVYDPRQYKTNPFTGASSRISGDADA